MWLRDGTRVAVRVPPGCLLLQAGRQLEHLTGGHVRAGWHEVVVTEATEAAAAAARAAGRPLWRVSSTVFAHVASAAALRPLGRFAARAGAAEAYPPMAAGEQVRRELEAIRLARGGGGGAGAQQEGQQGQQQGEQQGQQQGEQQHDKQQGQQQQQQSPAAAGGATGGAAVRAC